MYLSLTNFLFSYMEVVFFFTILNNNARNILKHKPLSTCSTPSYLLLVNSVKVVVNSVHFLAKISHLDLSCLFPKSEVILDGNFQFS